MEAVAPYAYFIGGIGLSIIWLIIYWLRPDLREKLIKTSVYGAIGGLFCAYWFLVDYWKPPSILGGTTIFFEDTIYCFTLCGITATIYDFLFNKKIVLGEKRRRKIFLYFFGLSFVIFIVFSTILNINSIVVNSFNVVLYATIMVCLRKDLFIPSVVTALFMLVFFTTAYYFVFNYICIDFWNKYWVLSGTVYDQKIFGFIPVTEIMWYVSWGTCGGIIFEFATGTKKMSRAMA